MTANPQKRELFAQRMGQLTRQWRIEVDRRLGPYGLTESRWFTLLQLSRMEEPVLQKDLAAVMGVQGPTLVRSLDWLEKEGLVERVAMPGDRRAKSLRLTQNAAPSLERIQTVVEQLRTEIFAGLADAERYSPAWLMRTWIPACGCSIRSFTGCRVPAASGPSHDGKDPRRRFPRDGAGWSWRFAGD